MKPTHTLQKALSDWHFKNCAMLGLGILMMAVTTRAQTTVFSDDFNDNNRNGWHLFNGDGTRSLDASAGTLETVSSGDFAIWGAVSTFNTVTIADGQYITLSLDFQIMEDVSSETISFGLFDSNGTTISADQSDLTNLTDESGYYMYNRSADLIQKAGNATGLGQVNGTDSMVKTQPSPFATADAIWHTYSLTITNNSGQASVTSVFDAGLGSELTQSDSGSAVDLFTFDSVSLQAIRKDYAIDNVLITTTGSVIPEPSSVALILSAAAAAIWRMRRKKG